MCYSISQSKRRAYKSALKENAPQEEIDRLYEEWQKGQEDDSHEDLDSPMAYLNGFEHPKLFTLIKDDTLHATRFTWGFIPEWVKNKHQAFDIRNKTLNARGETIFDRASFRSSAKDKRCLIFVNGFYEYYHFRGKKYPHFIRHADDQQALVFGGLWSEWVDHNTGEIFKSATIVTTESNKLLRRIHNNPKVKESRMPLILEPTDFDQWLTATSKKDVQALIRPSKNGMLEAYTVRRLIGKNGIGDSKGSTKGHLYPELVEQGVLF